MAGLEKHNCMQRFFIRTAYYYAIFLGVISLRIDFKHYRLEHSKLLQIYAFLLSVTIAVSTVVYFGAILDDLDDKNKFNYLDRLTRAVNSYTRTIVIILTLLLRPQRERFLLTLWNELLDMETAYFSKVVTSRQTKCRFKRLLYGKCFTAIYQSVAILIAMMQMSKSFSVYSWFISIFTSNMQNLITSVMFQYYAALWFICKRYTILNEQLLRIIADIRAYQQFQGNIHFEVYRQHIVAVELSTILKLHYRLTRLVLGLNNTFKFQIMGVMLTTIVNHIVLCYYGLANKNYTGAEMNAPFIIFGFLTAFLLLADFYLVDFICDIAVTEYQRTAEILRNFHEFGKLEKQLEQNCEIFSLQLMLHKLRINICGMFNLSKRSAFIIMVETVSQAIILLQFDYASRLRKHY